MQIIKQENVDIAELVKQLELGKVIVYPTETCYGLGCDATNQDAVDRLFEIKKRQKDKSVLVLVSDLGMAKKYIELSPKLLDLARKYWQGPLTMVIPLANKQDLASGVIGKDNTIAMRVTSHYFIEELCKEFGKPIVSTSANISGEANPYDIEAVLNMYKDTEAKPDIIIDAGVLPYRKPSTIVKIENNKVVVLRQGDLFMISPPDRGS